MGPEFRRVAVWTAAACWSACAGLALAVRHGRNPLPIDERLAGWMMRGPLEPIGHHGGRFVDALTPLVFGVCVLALVGVALAVGDRLLAVIAAAGPPLTLVVNEALLKPLVDRRALRFAALNYPSGHAASVAALGCVGVLLAWRLFGVRGLALGGAAASVAVAAMGIALVRAHAHLPTDTVGGALFAIGGVLLVAAAASWLAERRG